MTRMDQFVDDEVLKLSFDHATERAGAQMRVETFAEEEFQGLAGNFEIVPQSPQACRLAGDHERGDLALGGGRETGEDVLFLDAAEEFRTQGLRRAPENGGLDGLDRGTLHTHGFGTAEIGSEDDDPSGEREGFTGGNGDPGRFEHLQEEVPHFGMGFLDFVAKEQTSRRSGETITEEAAIGTIRTEEPLRGVLSREFREVETMETVGAEEEMSAEDRQFGLSHSGRTEEQEAALGTTLRRQTQLDASEARGDRIDDMVLSAQVGAEVRGQSPDPEEALRIDHATWASRSGDGGELPAGSGAFGR